MNKYKEYDARTQPERIALDTLAVLEEIRELLKTLNKSNIPEIYHTPMKIDTSKTTGVESAPKITATTKRKTKGDK